MVEANNLGTWSQVGYTGAGNSSANGSATGVFYYQEGSISSNAGTLWKAEALQKLNDCAKGDKWGLAVGLSGSEADGQSNAVYKAGASTGTGAKCLELTPSFTKLTSARQSPNLTLSF